MNKILFPSVKINKTFKLFKEKENFIKTQLKKSEKFIYVSYKHEFYYLDLQTWNKENKYFYKVPYNKSVDELDRLLAFQTKLESSKLLDLLVVFEAEFSIFSYNDALLFNNSLIA